MDISRHYVELYSIFIDNLYKSYYVSF